MKDEERIDKCHAIKKAIYNIDFFLVPFSFFLNWKIFHIFTHFKRRERYFPNNWNEDPNLFDIHWCNFFFSLSLSVRKTFTLLSLSSHFFFTHSIFVTQQISHYQLKIECKYCLSVYIIATMLRTFFYSISMESVFFLAPSKEWFALMISRLPSIYFISSIESLRFGSEKRTCA